MTTRIYDTTCPDCGGLVMHPQKAYGYAGPVCACPTPVRNAHPGEILGVDGGRFAPLPAETVRNLMRDDAGIESMIKDRGLTAPRVTPAQIDALMASLNIQVHHFPGTTTMVAMAFLPNGFSVGLGQSACADPKNFNYDVGARNATDNALRHARDQLWLLEGYCLKKELARPHVQD